jgi:hypothetical protein
LPFPSGRGYRKCAPGLAGSQAEIPLKGEVSDHKGNFDERKAGTEAATGMPVFDLEGTGAASVASADVQETGEKKGPKVRPPELIAEAVKHKKGKTDIYFNENGMPTENLSKLLMLMFVRKIVKNHIPVQKMDISCYTYITLAKEMYINGEKIFKILFDAAKTEGYIDKKKVYKIYIGPALVNLWEETGYIISTGTKRQTRIVIPNVKLYNRDQEKYIPVQITLDSPCLIDYVKISDIAKRTVIPGLSKEEKEKMRDFKDYINTLYKIAYPHNQEVI